MNIAKSALLLAGLLTAGSIFAQESNEWGRHVRFPGDAIAAHTYQVPELSLGHLSGYIDADVLDFHQETKGSQTLI